jgi:hypothetical protein
MAKRTRSRCVASIATLSLVCLVTIVLAALPAGTILGADRLIGQPGKDRFSGGAGRDHCESRGRERARGCE